MIGPGSQSCNRPLVFPSLWLSGKVFLKANDYIFLCALTLVRKPLYSNISEILPLAKKLSFHCDSPLTFLPTLSHRFIFSFQIQKDLFNAKFWFLMKSYKSEIIISLFTSRVLADFHEAGLKFADQCKFGWIVLINNEFLAFYSQVYKKAPNSLSFSFFLGSFPFWTRSLDILRSPFFLFRNWLIFSYRVRLNNCWLSDIFKYFIYL